MRRNYVRRILCLPSIVALLVISGKQLSSELLHTLRFICVCWPPKRQCSTSTTSSPQHGSTSCLPGNFLARVTMSTNVDDTPSSHRARVSHNIHNSTFTVPCTAPLQNLCSIVMPNICSVFVLYLCRTFTGPLQAFYSVHLQHHCCTF